jgi:hypothetical protein
MRWGTLGALCLLALAGCAEVDRLVREAGAPGGSGALDEATVVAGLREALRVGSQRAVGRVGRVDGYLGNALIRIALPESFESAAGTLRRVGFGKQVKELEVAMNRAAEQAAGEARVVLVEALRGMTIADGYRILRGGETAATDYFRQRTGATLRQRFAPIVERKMGEVGLSQLYERLSERYLALPFTRRDDLVDLDAHVTDKALDGLFRVLGEEERRIRKEPVARTSELLRKVFAGG